MLTKDEKLAIYTAVIQGMVSTLDGSEDKPKVGTGEMAKTAVILAKEFINAAESYRLL